MRLHVANLLANKRAEFLANYFTYPLRLQFVGLLANKRAEFLAIYFNYPIRLHVVGLLTNQTNDSWQFAWLIQSDFTLSFC